MTRRLNTIIIVPHSKAKFIKFSFSTRAVAFVGAVVVVAMALSLVAVMYLFLLRPWPAAEFCTSVFIECFLDLFFRIHDERSILNHGFINRHPLQQ